MESQKPAIYLQKSLLIIIAALLVIFPLFFLPTTSESFVLPKQILVILTTAILLLIFSLKMVFEKRVTLRSTPFNLPVLFFGTAVLLSSLFARNFYDSLLQSIPLLSLAVLYFVITNTIEKKSEFNKILYAVAFGAGLSSLISILNFFKLYLLPTALAQSQNFNTFGASLQEIIYLVPILLICVANFGSRLRNKIYNRKLVIFGISSLLISGALAVLFYQIFALSQKPVILPYIYGFQIGLASISQNAQRPLIAFLFGSGYGTFLTDFTRFRLPSFNQESIWNLTFSYSSSYFLEILATTGVLGALSFLLLTLKIIKSELSKLKSGIAKVNIIYFALLTIFLLSFILPFSYSSLFLIFVLLALYTAGLYFEKSPKIHTLTLSLVTLKRGLINFEIEQEAKGLESRVLPITIFILVFLVFGLLGILTLKLLNSDLKFKESLNQTAAGQGQKAYDLGRDAIAEFPYRTDYYLAFSQLNLALANSLAGTLSQNSTQSAQTQQTIVALLQQSINNAKQAALLSPQSVSAWTNLAQIYRNLIKVGQNAEQFAITSFGQALALDTYNPQLYIELGGVYFQLGQYENAVNQLQIAVNLKPDLANARYNLAHALEAKDDLKNALVQYQKVKELVQNDPQSLKKITDEIKTLEEKIGQKTEETKEASPTAQLSRTQPPLQLSSPSGAIKPPKVPVEIPPPPTTQSAELQPEL